jgi:hypothetical protein
MSNCKTLLMDLGIMFNALDHIERKQTMTNSNANPIRSSHFSDWVRFRHWRPFGR